MLLTAPLVIAVTVFGGMPFTAMVAAVAAYMFFEWNRMIRTRRRDVRAFTAIGAIVVACVAAWQGMWWITAAALASGGLIALTFFALRPPLSLWFAAGILYCGGGAVALLFLRYGGAEGHIQVAWVFLMVWASDTGAFVAGRWFGGPKVMPAVSPNKTWSGIAGSLICAMLASAAFAMLFGNPWSSEPALTGLLVGIAANYGDFLESWIKRQFSVKDSGAILPGHGGLLDRLDSFVVAVFTVVVLSKLGIVFTEAARVSAA